MKGILPAPCRMIGYILLALIVFAPMLIYMLGMINDGNLLYLKSGVNAGIWICLFMIFMAKHKHENDIIQNLRGKSLQYAFKIWGVVYILLSVKDLVMGQTVSANNSAAIIFMIICVLCFEFFTKKHKIEQQFKKKP